MPSADFRHEVTTTATLEQTWTALQDPNTWGALGGVKSVTAPKHDSDGDLLSYNFVAVAAAKSYDGAARTVVSERPREMAVQIVSKEMDGRIGIALAEESEHVRAEVTLRLEAKGLLSSMFFSVIAQVVGSGFPAQVKSLAERFEG